MQVTFGDVGAFIEGEFGLAEYTCLAGGAADGVYQTGGNVIDLEALEQRPTSAVVIVQYDASLAASETMDIAVKLQHDDVVAMTGAADYTYGPEVTKTAVETGALTNELGAVAFSFDLRGIKQFFRVHVKTTMSASGTDTADLSAVIGLFSGHTVADVS